MNRSAALILGWFILAVGCRDETRKPAAAAPPPETAPATAQTPGTDADALVGWLYEEGRHLDGIPFPEVMKAASGHAIFPADPADPICQSVLDQIARAAESVLARMNKPDSAIRNLRRINEASSHFEDALREALNGGDFTCEFPKTHAGEIQRSGYPDLMITHKPSGRIAYLDPKLIESGSRQSTLRTFYFEPRQKTGKVNADGWHFVLGITHDGADGNWQFLSWELVDLSKLKIRLKAEFQASNKDVYRPESILKKGRPGN